MVLFVPPILIASWAGIETVQDCRGHQLYVSRTHMDDKAVTSILHRGEVMWSGVPEHDYQSVVIDEIVEGAFDVETKFSDGSVRQSFVPSYITTMDKFHHYINIGKLEDANVDKEISFFSVVRNELSCLY
ncbi:MAG: hypothetical protein HWE30_15720 [Methylocystaceae bacterium]|nr:hypothetical protein [Methylocystaceae bacterium]